MIHPIQAFREMPAKKKVATAVGVVAAAGAVAAGTTAFIKGGKTEAFKNLGEDTKAFKKITTRMGEGFKKIGSDIAAIFQKLTKKGGDVVNEEDKVAKNVADAAQDTVANA